MPFGEEFRTAYGTGKQYRPVTAADRQRLEGQVPAFLLDFWDQDGWSGYNDGLIWFVDPDEYAPVLALWDTSQSALSLTPPLVVMRSAFGNLFYIETHLAPNGKPVQTLSKLDVLMSKYYTVSSFAEKYLTRTIAKPDYFPTVLMQAEVRRAIKDVGPLEWDEMYGFEPALPLGGSGAPETVRRVKIFNHHLMLSQLQQMTLQLL
jgi:hypothetical protein